MTAWGLTWAPRRTCPQAEDGSHPDFSPAPSLRTHIYPESSSALGKGRRRNQPLGAFCCRTRGGNSTCGRTRRLSAEPDLANLSPHPGLEELTAHLSRGGLACQGPPPLHYQTPIGAAAATPPPPAPNY